MWLKICKALVTRYVILIFSLRKPKVFALQILQRYLTKEGSRSKIFPLFIWIKEPCVRKFEGLERSKLLGISQTILQQFVALGLSTLVSGICAIIHQQLVAMLRRFMRFVRSIKIVWYKTEDETNSR